MNVKGNGRDLGEGGSEEDSEDESSKSTDSDDSGDTDGNTKKKKSKKKKDKKEKKKKKSKEKLKDKGEGERRGKKLKKGEDGQVNTVVGSAVPAKPKPKKDKRVSLSSTTGGVMFDDLVVRADDEGEEGNPVYFQLNVENLK